MRKTTFDYLCSKLKPAIERKTTRLREAISVEQRVAICTWCLATNVEYRTVAHLFGVSRSSVCLIVNNVCLAIVELLMSTHIQLPRNDEELLELVRGCKQSWGFPNCGGAIDGCHIPISVANSLHTDYYNRKGYYSVILQGLVDYRQGVRNSKKSCTRFHFLKDFKGFGRDFRFQNHRIWSVFYHVIFNIRRYMKIYSKEFAIRSHTKLYNTAPVILRFAATLR